MHKPPRLHHLCKTRADYRALWDEMAAGTYSGCDGPVARQRQQEGRTVAAGPGELLRKMIGCSGKAWPHYAQMDAWGARCVDYEVYLSRELHDYFATRAPNMSLPICSRMVQVALEQWSALAPKSVSSDDFVADTYAAARLPLRKRSLPAGDRGIITGGRAIHWPCLGALVLAAAEQRIGCAVADHGLRPWQREELERVGVQWITHPLPPLHRIVGSHGVTPWAWAKPWICGASPFASTLWIDADAVLLAPVGDLLRGLTGEIVASDAVYQPHSEVLYRQLIDCLPEEPQSVREAISRIDGVNTGVLGFRGGSTLITDWQTACEEILSHPRASQVALLRDQGAFVLLLARRAAEGRNGVHLLEAQWNWPADGKTVSNREDRLEVPLDPARLLQVTRERHPQAAVVHWLGRPKPWEIAVGARRKRSIQELCEERGLLPDGLRCADWEQQSRLQVCQQCGHWSAGPPRVCDLMDDGSSFDRVLKSTSGQCPQYHWTEHRISWLRISDLTAATMQLLPRLPAGIVGIVGIPRSGLIPATILATHSHLPLYAFVDGRLEQLTGGLRSREMVLRQGPLLVVDDSVGQGSQWRLLQEQGVLPEQAVRAAIFVTPHRESLVDLYARHIPVPHLFEWNFFNSGNILLASLDLDGIMCDDAPSLEIYDGGAREREWFATAPARDVPRNPKYPAPAIITARCERYREITEQWLQQHGACYRRLIMWPDAPERRTLSAVAQWKVERVREADVSFHVESDAQVVRAMRTLHCRVLDLQEGCVR